MTATPLYRQLFNQLSQWIIPKDLRHQTNCAEIDSSQSSVQKVLALHTGFPI